MTNRLMRRPPPQRSVKWIRLMENFMTAWDNGGYEVINYISVVSAAI